MAFSAKEYNKSKRKHRKVKSDPRITENYVFFHMSWPSQWHKTPMIINNVQYNCCEQYMMAQKAILFDDQNCLKQIMRATDPKDQKQLGRKVKNYNQKEWDKHKKQIIYDGNYAKFTQNKKLNQLLLSFGNRTFVEASRSDKIYGIGMGVMDEKANNKTNWKGQNLLGYTISAVRDKLMLTQNHSQSEDNKNDSNI
eukprot:674396_1